MAALRGDGGVGEGVEFGVGLEEIKVGHVVTYSCKLYQETHLFEPQSLKGNIQCCSYQLMELQHNTLLSYQMVPFCKSLPL